LKLLNDDGILSFILPKNFINCLYYDKLRKYIYNNYNIINIIDCSNDKYLETQQDTIIFIIQNTKNVNNYKYTINISSFTIFNTEENIIKLNNLYKNSTLLYNLGCNITVGNIIWNENKNLLTNDNTKTRLIYSSDILSDNTLSISNRKKNYINKDGFNDLCIIINRGYGNGKYKFNYCLLDVKYNYLLENHIIVIKNNNKNYYLKILNSFKNKKTFDFINIFFGNNAINTTELKYILPIYLDDI
jgi:hypothetical protein